MTNLSTDMKLNDTRPIFRTTVLDGADIVPLNAVSQVLLIIDRPDPHPLLTLAMTIESPPEDGIVSYTWVNGDLPVVGVYKFEVEVTWTNGSKQTFPAATYGTITVYDDLD